VRRGVAEHVAHGLDELVPVAEDRQRASRVDVDLALRVRRAQVGGRVADHLGEVDRDTLDRHAAVGPGQREQVVDEPAHPGALGLDPAQ
jgi:hypothetical protein